MIHPEQFTSGQRRILALVILVVMIAVAWALLVMPLRGVAVGYEQKLQRLNQRIAGARIILEEGQAAREQLNRLALVEKRHGYYLENNRPTLAAAELQRRVKQSVEEQGGSIVSSQILGEQEQNGLHRVVLRVNLRMELPTLEKILHELETQPPVLHLNNVTISARPSGSTARWRGSGDRQILDVSLDIMGYRKQVNDNG